MILWSAAMRARFTADRPRCSVCGAVVADRSAYCPEHTAELARAAQPAQPDTNEGAAA